MVNASVERFKKLTEELQREVRAAAIAELNAQGDSLVELIKSVAPRGESGQLEHSIRKIHGKSDTQIRIFEGSPSTVKAGYAYPRAQEFGTVNMPPKPHFFPSYRLRKKKIIAAMKRRITASIKKRSAQ